VELVVKLNAVQTWTKLVDLGTGSYLDSLAIGWYSNTNSIEVENYDNIPVNAIMIHETTLPFLMTPTLNRWYHIAVIITPSVPISSNAQNTAWGWVGNYAVYVNGLLVATMNSTLGNYPFPIHRQDAYIGKSNWQADANALAEYDALRIYDYAIPASSVPYLAQTYNCYSGTPLSSTGPYGPPGGTAGTSSSSSSSLSGGAIAGIVIGSVVGAFVLMMLLFFVCRGAGDSTKKASSDDRNHGRLEEENTSAENSQVEMGHVSA